MGKGEQKSIVSVRTTHTKSNDISKYTSGEVKMKINTMIRSEHLAQTKGRKI